MEKDTPSLPTPRLVCVEKPPELQHVGVCLSADEQSQVSCSVFLQAWLSQFCNYFQAFCILIFN
jgi:hypothetical protein